AGQIVALMLTCPGITLPAASVVPVERVVPTGTVWPFRKVCPSLVWMVAVATKALDTTTSDDSVTVIGITTLAFSTPPASCAAKFKVVVAGPNVVPAVSTTPTGTTVSKPNGSAAVVGKAKRRLFAVDGGIRIQPLSSGVATGLPKPSVMLP